MTRRKDFAFSKKRWAEERFRFSFDIAAHRIGLLSKRERVVVCAVAFGMPAKEAARAMKIELVTFKRFIQRARVKLFIDKRPLSAFAQLWFLAHWTHKKGRDYQIPDFVSKYVADHNRRIREMRIVAAYVDGGVVLRNPSEVGGTWGVVLVGAEDTEVSRHSGFISPEEVGLPAVSNNVTELLAAIEAMERLPAGWEGAIYTDSFVTLCRLTSKTPKMNGVPDPLQQRMWNARNRLGKYECCLLDGHPTKAQLKRGIGKKGNRVSKWNVICDDLCGLEAARISLHGDIVAVEENTPDDCITEAEQDFSQDAPEGYHDEVCGMEVKDGLLIDNTDALGPED